MTIISENQNCLTVHFITKVLYWRINVRGNVIATMIAKWSWTLFRKDRWLSRLPNIQWSQVHAGDAYQSVTYDSPVAQTWIRRKESDDELIWSDRDWKQTDWTQLLPFHWYFQELICIRKTKFHKPVSICIYIDCVHGLKTNCVLTIKHWILRNIIKMNK